MIHQPKTMDMCSFPQIKTIPDLGILRARHDGSWPYKSFILFDDLNASILFFCLFEQRPCCAPSPGSHENFSAPCAMWIFQLKSQKLQNGVAINLGATTTHP